MFGVLIVISACLLWALDSLIRYPMVSEGVNPLSLVFFDHLFLVPFFLPLIFRSFKRILKASMADAISFFVIGALGSGMATLCFTEAFIYLNPSLVILLQKFQPMVAIILAHYVLGEKIGKEFYFWGALALAGALMISYEDLLVILESQEDVYKFFIHQGAGKGYVYVFLAVLGWGASTVFGKRLTMRGLTAQEILAGRFLIGTIALVPWMTYENAPLVFSGMTYVKFLAMALISGMLSMYLYYKGLKMISAKACTLAEMSFPFWAVLINWLFLGKTLSIIQLVGGGVLIFASMMIQMRKL